MTLEEAQKLAKIVQYVDGGCGVCVSSIVHELNEAFVGFEWTYDENALSDDTVSVKEVAVVNS